MENDNATKDQGKIEKGPAPAASVVEPAPESTPVEPVAEPTPAVASVIESPSVVDPTPILDNSDEPKTPKKLPLIIAAAVAVVLLIGGIVGAIAFFSWKNSPETIALDAISNLAKEKAVSMNGKIKINFEKPDIYYNSLTDLPINNSSDTDDDLDDEDSDDETYISIVAPSPVATYPESIEISLKNNSDSNANIETTAEVEIKMTDDQTEKFSVDFIYVPDGTIYLKSSQLLDYLNDYFAASIKDSKKNSWWKISQSDIVDSLSSFLGVFAGILGDTISCSTNMVNNLAGNTGELVDLYSKNNFAKFKEQSKNSYLVEFDTNKMASFFNGLNDTSFVKKYSSCLEGIKDNYEYGDSIEISFLPSTEKVTADDFNNLPSQLRVETNDKRQMTRMSFSGDVTDDLNVMNGFDYSVDVSFAYPGNINIDIPSDANSLTDVIFGIFQNLFMSSYTWTSVSE